MKVVVLIDNSPHPHMDLLTEHGLSIYIEADNYKWLMDVGESGKFADNADRLGIDIAQVDYLILSHAHRDHTGGLTTFIEQNDKASIFLSSHIAGNAYYSLRRGLKRDITPDYSIVENDPGRFILIDADIRLSPNVAVVCRIPSRFDLPKGNRTLLVNQEPDDFRHEMALSIFTAKGNVVFSSCAHMGLMNTLSACSDQHIMGYFGGTHLLDSDVESQYETYDQLTAIANTLRSSYPLLNLYVGHCTGEAAKGVFSSMLGDSFIPFYSGFTIEI